LLAYDRLLEPISHFYYSHRLKLQFWDWGQDGKPSLILVHGGLDHARNWDWVARSLREYFQGSNNDKVKAEIFKEQMKPARILGELMERLEELRKAGEARDKEMSPRWQAHYDYVLAELLARTAYVSEYNLMLGKIRKDELPELRPSVQTGWRLASRDKMQSGKDIKDMATESKKLFAKLIKDHPGTPWEILAKRESLTALGLDWQPSS